MSAQIKELTKQPSSSRSLQFIWQYMATSEYKNMMPWIFSDFLIYLWYIITTSTNNRVRCIKLSSFMMCSQALVGHRLFVRRCTRIQLAYNYPHVLSNPVQPYLQPWPTALTLCQSWHPAVMRDYFYYMACPLCQHDVDPSQPDYYRVLPLDSEKMTVFNEKPVCDEYNCIKIGDLTIDPGLCYPDLEYMQKAWCLHTRCLAFVDHLPLAKLYILLDLVEPTFLRRRNEPKSRYGDFYSQPIQEQDPIPAPTVAPSRQMTKSLWEALRHFFFFFTVLSKRKEQLDSPSSPLSPAPYSRSISHDSFISFSSKT